MTDRHIYTAGGAYVEDHVHVEHGDFVGRDKNVYIGPAFPRPNYRQEIADILGGYMGFIGREDEWQRVVDLSHNQQSGYLLVEAPAGYGKTAFLVELIRRSESQQWPQPTPQLLYFFIRHEGRRNTAEAFLRGINAQLLTLVRGEGGVPPDLSSLRNQFSTLWERALATTSPDRPLLLLIDGLDEMAPGQLSIATELPTALADHVHIVVTSRPNPEPLTQVSPTHPFRRAAQVPLHRFTVAEIERLLTEQGLPADRLTAFAPAIHRLTRGEPLIARFVAQETAQAELMHAAGDTVLQRLAAQPPKDVADYFAQQLDMLKDSAQAQLTRRILGLLLETLGGVTAEELADVLEASQWDVEDALAAIQRFLLGRDRIELMHLELRCAVEKLFSRRERRIHRQQLLTWCRSYQEHLWPDKTPIYVLHHYAQHLVDAIEDGETELLTQLYRLVDKRWMNLKLTHTYSHRSFADDLELVIESATKENPLNWSAFVPACFVYSTLIDRTMLVTPKIIDGLPVPIQVDELHSYIDMISDPTKRSDMYYLLTDTFRKQGDTTRAEKFLELALDAVKYLETDKQESRLRQISILLAKSQNYTRAAEVAETIPNLYERAKVLLSILHTLENTEGRAKAVQLIERLLNIAGTIDRAHQKAEIHVAIAQTLIQRGEKNRAVKVVDQALVYIEAVELEAEKVDVIHNALDVLVGAGKVNQALLTAQFIQSEQYKAEAFTRIAVSLAKTGEHEIAHDMVNRSLERIDKVQNIKAKAKAKILAQLAHTLTLIGDRTGADEVAYRVVKAIDKIEDKRSKAGVLISLMDTLVKILSVEELVKICQLLEIDSTQKDRHAAQTAALTDALIGSNKIEDALDLVHLIKEHESRVPTLLLIAQKLVLTDKPRAKEIALQALQILKHGRKHSTSKSELADIAHILVKAGAVDDALSVAEGSDDEHLKISIMETAITQLVAIGEFTKAQNLANHAISLIRLVLQTRQNSEILTLGIRILLVTEGVEQALRAKELLLPAYERDKALLVIAQALTNIRNTGGALEVTHAIYSKRRITIALHDIIQTLIDQGQQNKARETIMKALKVINSAELVELGHQALEWKLNSLTSFAALIVTMGDSALIQEVKMNVFKLAVALQAEQLTQQATIKSPIEDAVRRFTEIGEQDFAIDLTMHVTDKKEQSKLLMTVSVALAQRGKLDQALAITEAEGGREHRDTILGIIIDRLLENGEPDQAITMLETIEGKWQKTRTILAVVKKLLKIGRIEQVFIVADNVEEFSTLHEIARVLLDAGYKTAAKKFAERALASVEPLNSYLGARHQDLRDVLRVLTNTGETVRAQEAIQQIAKLCEANPNLHAHQWIELAEDLTMIGDIDQAIQLAERYENARDKTQLLRTIIHTLANSGYIEQALVVADSITDPSSKEGALLTIIKKIVDIGSASQALVLTEQISSAGMKARALASIAEYLLKTQQVAQAGEVAEHAFVLSKQDPYLDRTWRNEILLVVAQIRLELQRDPYLDEIAQLMYVGSNDDGFYLPIGEHKKQALDKVYILVETGNLEETLALASELRRLHQDILQLWSGQIARAGQKPTVVKGVVHSMNVGRRMGTEALWKRLGLIIPLLNLNKDDSLLWEIYTAITEVETWFTSQ